MDFFISLDKYKNKLLSKFNKKQLIFLANDIDIASYVEKNFDPKNRYIIFTEDGFFLFSYLTKIPYTIVGPVSDEHSAHMTAEHNKTNILIVPMILISDELAESIVKKFLAAEFEDNRHMVRLNMLVKELKPYEKI